MGLISGPLLVALLCRAEQEKCLTQFAMCVHGTYLTQASSVRCRGEACLTNMAIALSPRQYESFQSAWFMTNENAEPCHVGRWEQRE